MTAESVPPTQPVALGPAEVEALRKRLHALRKSLLDIEVRSGELGKQGHESWHLSARNLLHYVALRSQDLRELQDELGDFGLSSLGRCESHVLSNINAVLDILQRISPGDESQNAPTGSSLTAAQARIEQATEALFGPPRAERAVRIMVTMPPEAAEEYALVRDLIVAGMDTMRINCAHDDVHGWAKMIAHVRQAELELGRKCPVLMDLAGPKIRTAIIEPGPSVLHWRPKRDTLGRVLADARIWLTDDPEAGAPLGEAAASVPVDAEWLMSLEIGDVIRFRDAAGRKRQLLVTARDGAGVWAASRQSTFLVPQLALGRYRGSRTKRLVSETRVGNLPPQEQAIELQEGDTIVVTEGHVLGRPAQRDPDGRVVSPARIGCTSPEVFSCLQVQDRILFDDGKIEGVIEEVQAQQLVVRIARAGQRKAKLKADKGINFPDSRLTLPALTAKDLADLEFVCQHADAVNYSFVRQVEDVHRLQEEIARLGRPDLAIILKIENRQAFESLPRLLLAAMRSPVAGVMIARGDLAVECGFERMSEVQEEILWMCEAAHMPVVWATQVLETLAKTGLPSRAEVTDAAMGVRAECVMLNKGPHIISAVRTLDDILQRMQEHQVKKRPMLRRLQIAQDLFLARE